MSRPQLTVVTRQRWRAADLAPYADVHLDLGLDTCAAADLDTILWCPGAWAAAALTRFPHLRLAAAGEAWLDQLPRQLTGRDIMTVSAGLLGDRLRQVAGIRRTFTKLPETKYESFGAAVRTLADLTRDLPRLPDDEPVQMQTPVSFTDEVRCWVVRREVVARAPYFSDQPRENWSSLADFTRAASAAAWLDTTLAAGSLPIPPALVIDVGWCHNPVSGKPGWRIIEANTPWSSDWYEADNMAAVIEAITISQRDVPEQWCWQPSPLLARRCQALASR